MLLLLGTGPLFAEQGEARSLTVEEAKLQLFQLYAAAEANPPKLRTKYPDLRKADEAARAAGKAYTTAVTENPKLKPRFAEIDAMGLPIAERMKLWKPLFEAAEKLPELRGMRHEYDRQRVRALRAELGALKAEGFDKLASEMEEILAQVRLGSPAEQPAEQPAE